MPSKPRTLAGILRLRRHADAEYNRARRGDPDRGVEDAVVSSARWKALRARVLRDEPLCRACAAAGRTELATQVDHVVPVRVRPDLAYDRTNLQPLCHACHNLKTMAERQVGQVSCPGQNARPGQNAPGQNARPGQNCRPCAPEQHSGGVGGTSSSHAPAAYGGARGVPLFSRVPPPVAAPPPDRLGSPVTPALAGDRGAPDAPPGAPCAEDAQTAAMPQERALAGDSAPTGGCDAKPALSGGIPQPGGRQFSPRDLDAMAVGPALTHGLPLEEVRARIEAALARGVRALEFP